MKKITSSLLVAALLLTISLTSSCSGSCNCTKELECSTLTSINTTTGKIRERKVYCSSIDYRSDQIFLDSITIFYARNSSDSTSLSRTDSITSSEFKSKIKRKESGSFEKKGFTCACAK